MAATEQEGETRKMSLEMKDPQDQYQRQLRDKQQEEEQQGS